jgi:hypothetical protein
MRPTLVFVVLAPLAASAAEETEPQDIVVTATRDERSAIQTPASISRIDDKTIRDIDSKHQADVLNRNAGVYIQRGSGAESLGAIRSPVLTGAWRLRRFPGRRRQPAHPAHGLLQPQRNVRDQLRTGAPDRSLARPGIGDVRRQAPCTASSTSSRRVSSTAVVFGGPGSRFGFVRARPARDVGRKRGRSRGFGAYGVFTRAPGWRDFLGRR